MIRIIGYVVQIFKIITVVILYQIRNEFKYPLSRISVISHFLNGPVKYFSWFYIQQSKLKGNDQELIQSNTSSNPQILKGKKHTHKYKREHERHAK